jgi:Protein of unknwon function (DUF3310)
MKPSTSANDRQVGGDHYQADIQHWDWVWSNDLNYFEGQITKYVMRARKKNGLQDLEKARHFLDKYMELLKGEPDPCEPGRTYVNPDNTPSTRFSPHG